MRFLAVLLAAGALAACKPVPPVTEAPDIPAGGQPGDVLSSGPADHMPERCREWLEWIVDGNGPPPHPLAQLRIPFIAVDQMSRACLGRPGDPYQKRPVPDLEPIGKPKPEDQPEPSAERIDI